ncbi:hypothetical protein [Actinomadura gamaensis]|uniref:Uncharacterized protein n=1 Tax=Actinomadura gamaensis TaxID=1763541 RepID=A0ABV9TZ93_9ACTN
MTTPLIIPPTPAFPANRWPDRRTPDNTRIDQQIRELGYDPDTKKKIGSEFLATSIDLSSAAGEKVLRDALSDPTNYVVLVRGSELTYTPGPFEAVTDLHFNCTPDQADYDLTWNHTVGSTATFAVSAAVGASFYGVVNASLTASFGLSWQQTDSVSRGHTLPVASKHVGWLERSAALHILTGEIWIFYALFGDVRLAFYGNGGITGPATDGRPKGAMVSKDRAMTQTEKNQWCGAVPAPFEADPLTLPGGLLPFLDPADTTPVVDDS